VLRRKHRHDPREVGDNLDKADRLRESDRMDLGDNSPITLITQKLSSTCFNKSSCSSSVNPRPTAILSRTRISTTKWPCDE
jgi:hypothetical protein